MNKQTMQDVVSFYKDVMKMDPVDPNFHGEAFNHMEWFRPLMVDGRKPEEVELGPDAEAKFKEFQDWVKSKEMVDE